MSYLVAAYSISLLILGGYVGYLVRQTRAARAELGELDRT